MATIKTLSKQIITVLFSNLLFIGFGCTPENQITDKNYKISIVTQSSLTDKQIADNTTLLLIEKGETDSLKTYTTNGIANFSFEAAENSNLSLEVHVKETPGHNGYIYHFSTDKDKSINLTLEAKTHSVPVTFNTTKEEIPIGNIEYFITPGNISGETDAIGNKIISFPLNTNDYNEPSNTDAIFDFSESSTTKPMSYNRTIVVQGENKFTFDLTKETYQHIFNVSTSGNIKTPLLTNSIGTVNYDNETTSFDPNDGIVSFVSDDETENVNVKVSNVPGYENGEIDINNVGSRTKNGGVHNIVLEGIIYDATQPIFVTDGTNPISGANINYTFGEETGTNVV